MSSKFSKTFLKNVERFEKQKARMQALETAYETHTNQYYAKNKRHNLLGNEFEKLKSINPYKLTPKELNKVLRDNVKATRQLGFTSSMSGDYAEGLVLVALNNEAYDIVDWIYEDDYEYWLDKQADVMGQYLFDSLKSLRLTKYQLNRVLEQSNLPEDIVEEVVGSISDEYDRTERPEYDKYGKDAFTIDGGLRLSQVEELTGLNLSKYESDTAAGLVMEECGEIPVKGQKVSVGDWIFEVTEISAKRIVRIKLYPDTGDRDG